jgi:hypothetical protein
MLPGVRRLVAFVRYGQKSIFETVAAWAGLVVAACFLVFVVACGWKLDHPASYSARAVFTPLFVADAAMLAVPLIACITSRATRAVEECA